jgi:hypothetical protein
MLEARRLRVIDVDGTLLGRFLAASRHIGREEISMEKHNEENEEKSIKLGDAGFIRTTEELRDKAKEAFQGS